jgi:preprotein translocase subunit SecE
MNRIISFLKEVKIELKRVNWPSRRETLNYTLLVIGISLAIAAFLGGLDVIFNAIVKNTFL